MSHEADEVLEEYALECGFDFYFAFYDEHGYDFHWDGGAPDKLPPPGDGGTERAAPAHPSLGLAPAPPLCAQAERHLRAGEVEGESQPAACALVPVYGRTVVSQVH